MTRKQRRSAAIVTAVAVLSLALGLVLYAMRESIEFFYTPSRIAEKQVQPTKRIRLGGIVAEKSLKIEGIRSEFEITDTLKSIKVTFEGTRPDLFREGQGVVAIGRLGSDGVFKADTILARHDETYMPAEVAKELKELGVWRDKVKSDVVPPKK